MAKYCVWAHFPYSYPPLTGTPWGRGVFVLGLFPSPPLSYLLHVRGCLCLYSSLDFHAKNDAFPPQLPFAGLSQASCMSSPKERNWKTKSDVWMEKGRQGRACCIFCPFPQFSVDLLGDSVAYTVGSCHLNSHVPFSPKDGVLGAAWLLDQHRSNLDVHLTVCMGINWGSWPGENAGKVYGTRGTKLLWRGGRWRDISCMGKGGVEG